MLPPPGTLSHAMACLYRCLHPAEGHPGLSLSLHVDDCSPMLCFTLAAKCCCLPETAERHSASLDLQSDVVVTSKLKAALGLAQLHNKKYKMAAKRFTEVGAACPLLPGGHTLPSLEVCAASQS